MSVRSKAYAGLGCAVFCVVAHPQLLSAQLASAASESPSACAALLADNPQTGMRLERRTVNANTDTSVSATRADSASFGVGGARSGPPDIILQVGVHADQVRFAKQPQVRVRLCWGGDTVRVVQRDNLPSPVVAGTTYRNVYVAVELLGRLNAECLADRLGVRGSGQPGQPPRTNVPSTPVSNCGFLGGTAGVGAQTPRPPGP
ncbi:MAG: hypothetical protein ABR585_09325 [Gemmatimonadaceae bacterium]